MEFDSLLKLLIPFSILGGPRVALARQKVNDRARPAGRRTHLILLVPLVLLKLLCRTNF